MRILAAAGDGDPARVYLADLATDGRERLVEFVESIQPPLPREEKWVLMVSTLLGCPVACPMCDAGGSFHGRLSAEEIIRQIDYLVDYRYPGRSIPAGKFKIQLARLGEPALNPAVLEVLRELPGRYDAPGLLPSLSTIAPQGCETFFAELAALKHELYPGGRFQLQFSIHTTDPTLRDKLIPAPKWDFDRIARYAEEWFTPGDRQITLNFALGADSPVEPQVMLKYFDPERFLVKLTPLNPTYRAHNNNLRSYLSHNPAAEDDALPRRLREAGYRVIVSLGQSEEDLIGSNCGQFLQRHLKAREKLTDGYTRPVEHPTARQPSSVPMAGDGTAEVGVVRFPKRAPYSPSTRKHPPKERDSSNAGPLYGQHTRHP